MSGKIKKSNSKGEKTEPQILYVHIVSNHFALSYSVQNVYAACVIWPKRKNLWPPKIA